MQNTNEKIVQELKELQENNPELYQMIINIGKAIRDNEIVDEFAKKHSLIRKPVEEQL